MRCLVTNGFKDCSVSPAVTHAAGGFIEIEDREKLARWFDQKLVRPTTEDPTEDWPWGLHAGADIHPVRPRPRSAERVVACLNYWNDLWALEKTVPSWADHVDHVIAVDGAYPGMWDSSKPWSTDGSTEYLEAQFGARLQLLAPDPTRPAFLDQIAKRQQYLDASRAGDMLFIVDADEWVEGAACLMDVEAAMDVGWIRVSYPEVYRREYRQPRLFSAQAGLRYQGRHHWMYVEDRLLTTHQYGGPGWDHRMVPLKLVNMPHIRKFDRQHQRAHHRTRQAEGELELRSGQRTASDRQVGAREALRVLHMTTYDAGNVVYRLHTAINSTTPHSSLFARHVTAEENPYNTPHQYRIPEDMDLLRIASLEVDVVHCHLTYGPWQQLGSPRDVPLVIHHHGTMYRRAPEARNSQDARLASLRLVSNLELLQYGEGLHYLPNPVPVAQYRRYAQETALNRSRGRPFRICHSPSKRQLKGTEDFLVAIAGLQAKGLNVEAVLIEGEEHIQTLRIKATCDACFDSFWLGMQCSGLESAAMGQPVVAGDPVVRERYQDWLGHVPYVYADNGRDLEEVLGQLVTDRGYYLEAATEVGAYVLEHHDTAAVALRYLDLLDQAIGWRAHMQGIRAATG